MAAAKEAIKNLSRGREVEVMAVKRCALGKFVRRGSDATRHSYIAGPLRGRPRLGFRPLRRARRFRHAIISGLPEEGKRE